MSSGLRTLFIALVFLALPPSAFAQFELIQEVPDQEDNDHGINGHLAIMAANGDVLVFITKNGDPSVGSSANLNMHRTTDGGSTWAEPVVLDTSPAGESQSIGPPKAVVLPSGDILLTYSFLNVIPNFFVSNKVWISSDHGMTWTRLDDKPTESAELVLAPSGLVVSLDWVDDGFGNLDFHSSTYDVNGDTWTPNGLVAESDPICSQTIEAASNSEWAFYYADCVFGFGGINKVFRQVTTDGGMNWSAPEEVFTADSGFGGTLGSVTLSDGGMLTAVYSSGTVISYRTSSDGGANWSAAENWTGGTEDNGDISPRCSPSEYGPLCTFMGRRGTDNQVVHIGIAGVSWDPLFGPLPFAINPGLTDAWFNDLTPGQGFLIVVLPDTGIIFLAWFTYDTERPPEDVIALLGEAGHRWVTAQGPFDGDTANLTVYLTQGGVFDMAEPPAVTDVDNPIGTITIVWHDCSSATLTYEINPPGVMGQIELRRIVPDNVALCEVLNQQ